MRIHGNAIPAHAEQASFSIPMCTRTCTLCIPLYITLALGVCNYKLVASSLSLATHHLIGFTGSEATSVWCKPTGCPISEPGPTGKAAESTSNIQCHQQARQQTDWLLLIDQKMLQMRGLRTFAWHTRCTTVLNVTLTLNDVPELFVRNVTVVCCPPSRQCTVLVPVIK